MNACELCHEASETPVYLCASCERETGHLLCAFPALYADLAAFLPRGASTAMDGGRGGTVSHPPMPVSEEPLSLRGPGGIVGVLEDWQAALHADRWWAAPSPAGEIPQRIAAASGALVRSLGWIAKQWPQAGDFAEEIRDLHRGVTSITAPPVRKGVRMGYCPAIYSGQECRAVLQLPPGETVITCAWCQAEYPEQLWPWLRNVQAELEAAS